MKRYPPPKKISSTEFPQSRIRTLLIILALLVPQAAAAQQVSIDVGEKSEPISPYIYGQFIEHLGRCIYGGIWAEMLEDRKFFYPVTGQAPAWELYHPGDPSWEGEGHPYELLMRSPWMVIGKESTVRMATDNTLSGDQEPAISVPGDGSRAGIYQERLALQKGRAYHARVVVSGSPDAGPIEVSLVWGGGASDRQTRRIEKLSSSHATYTFVFESAGDTDRGVIEIVARGSGSFRVGTASLMPADNINGWRKDVVALLRELDAPVYRWPGGNFVSGYDWRDGVGLRDRRPPRKNPAWTGVEHNDVGMHEYLELMRLLGTEAFIAVNTGLGGAEEAAAQLEYVNGAVGTPMGQLRTQNGHTAPWNVRWWAIGNEMYGDWQLGHMPLEEYVQKHNRVVDAMREVDPDIRPIAVGAMGEWSETILGASADHMDLISEHIYWQDREDLGEHVGQVTVRIKEVADAHRRYRTEIDALDGKDIRIALDEWNYWYGPYEYGELGTRYFLQDALGIAAGLHEFFRNSDIYLMANYAQTVNVIGAIKTTPTESEFEPTGLVLKLYRKHFGSVPVKVSTDVDGLDVSAALTSDGKHVTLSIVNSTNDTRELGLEIIGANCEGPARKWLLTGENKWSHNIPGEKRSVDIEATTLKTMANGVVVPPLAIGIWEIPIK